MGIDHGDNICRTKNSILNATKKTSKTSKAPKKPPKSTKLLTPKMKFVDQSQTLNLKTLNIPQNFFDISHTSHGRPGRVVNM